MRICLISHQNFRQKLLAIRIFVSFFMIYFTFHPNHRDGLPSAIPFWTSRLSQVSSSLPLVSAIILPRIYRFHQSHCSSIFVCASVIYFKPSFVLVDIQQTQCPRWFFMLETSNLRPLRHGCIKKHGPCIYVYMTHHLRLLRRSVVCSSICTGRHLAHPVSALILYPTANQPLWSQDNDTDTQPRSTHMYIYISSTYCCRCCLLLQVPRWYGCVKRVTSLESSHGHHLPVWAVSMRAPLRRGFDPKRPVTPPPCRASSSSFRVGCYLASAKKLLSLFVAAVLVFIMN